MGLITFPDCHERLYVDPPQPGRLCLVPYRKEGEARGRSKLVSLTVQNAPVNLSAFIVGTTLNLDPHLNLIVGENESGKTTLLRSIARTFYSPGGRADFRGSVLSPAAVQAFGQTPLSTEDLALYARTLEAISDRKLFGKALNHELGAEDFILDLDVALDKPQLPEFEVSDGGIGRIGVKNFRTDSRKRSQQIVSRDPQTYSPAQLASLKGEEEDHMQRRLVELYDEPEGAWSIWNQVREIQRLIDGILERDRQAIIVTHAPLVLATVAAANKGGKLFYLGSDGIQEQDIEDCKIPIPGEILDRLVGVLQRE